MASFDISLEQICAHLKTKGCDAPEPAIYPDGFFKSPARPASVLLPLFRNVGEWHLLYIRRSEFEGDQHSGQVAFPGGKVDQSDLSVHHAALREAEEEVGLSAGDVTLLGELAEYRTISNFLVKPIVAKINWPIDLTPDSREVSRVFSIPVNWLLDPKNHTVSERPLQGYQQPLEVVHFQRFDGELLWGITAKLTLSLLSVIDTGEGK